MASSLYELYSTGADLALKSLYIATRRENIQFNIFPEGLNFFFFFPAASKKCPGRIELKCRLHTVFCFFLVPGIPEKIKALAMTADSIKVTWSRPAEPNGNIVKYNIYIQHPSKVVGYLFIKLVLFCYISFSFSLLHQST